MHSGPLRPFVPCFVVCIWIEWERTIGARHHGVSKIQTELDGAGYYGPAAVKGGRRSTDLLAFVTLSSNCCFSDKKLLKSHKWTFLEGRKTWNSKQKPVMFFNKLMVWRLLIRLEGQLGLYPACIVMYFPPEGNSGNYSFSTSIPVHRRGKYRTFYCPTCLTD